jgi:uncharacterized protein YggE
VYGSIALIPATRVVFVDQQSQGRATQRPAGRVAPEIKEVIMAGSSVILGFSSDVTSRLTGIALLAMAAAVVPAQAQGQQAQSSSDGRVVVIGEGSVSVTPDHAQIESGVTTRAKTVKEAADVNSKLMAAITSALLGSGIAQNDVQTSRFSVQPVYAPQEPRTELKLAGYSVSNHVTVKIRQIGNVGEILDRLVAAGVTDLGNIVFLVSDPSKALDQAREAAIDNARHKAEIYTKASGLQLGKVVWITEDPGFASPIPMRTQGASAAMAAPIPISTGEDTLRARITVGFEIAR